MDSKQAKALLRNHEWSDKKIIPLVDGPYRYRIVAECSPRGRQKAEFANGEHPYFCYVEIVSGNGSWSPEGNAIVPVLPDGRLLMIVEQRAPGGRYPDRPTTAVVSGEPVDLLKYGPYSSLEFPSGGIEPGEKIKAAFLRELAEETGVADQTVVCYSCLRPCYPNESEMATRQNCHVVFLNGFSYQEYVPTDGGLDILALTHDEVQENIWRGVIRFGNSALQPWSFYKEVLEARHNKAFLKKLLDIGYLTVELLRVAV